MNFRIKIFEFPEETEVSKENEILGEKFILYQEIFFGRISMRKSPLKF